VRPTERIRTLGTGRGRPLLHAQEAEWRGLAVHLESVDLTPAGTELGWRRRIGDHLGLLLPEGTEVEWGGTATLDATIPSSGLTVVLR
jgi:hypothetical protein